MHTICVFLVLFVVLLFSCFSPAASTECALGAAYPELLQADPVSNGKLLYYTLAATTNKDSLVELNSIGSRIYIIAATSLDESVVHIVEAKQDATNGIGSVEHETVATFDPRLVRPIAFANMPLPGVVNSIPPMPSSGPAPAPMPISLFETVVMLTNHALIGIRVEGGYVSTYAGVEGVTGTTDGANPLEARFGASGYVTLYTGEAKGPNSDRVSQLYIADTDNHCIRRYMINAAMLNTVAGVCGSPGLAHGSGTGPTMLFNYPSSITYFQGHTELFIYCSGSGILRSVKIDDNGVTDSSAEVRLTNPLTNTGSMLFPDFVTMDFYPTALLDFSVFAESTKLKDTFSNTAVATSVMFATGSDCVTYVVQSYGRGFAHVATIPADIDGTTFEHPDETACSFVGGDVGFSFTSIGTLPAFNGKHIVSVVAPSVGATIPADEYPGSSFIADAATCNTLNNAVSSDPSTPASNIGGTNDTTADDGASDNTTTVIIVVVVVVGVVAVVVVLAVVFLKKGEKVHPAGEGDDASSVQMGTVNGTMNGSTGSALTASTMPMEQSHDPKYPSYPGSVAGSQATTAATINVGDVSLMGLPEDENERKQKLCEEGRYQKNKLLGRGANGSVYSCVLIDGSTVAMKEVLLPSNAADLLADIQKEVDIVSALHHPHVVEYYGSRNDMEDMKLLLFMEIVSAGSLASMARNVEEPLNVEIARAYAKQMVEAVAYIHGKGVVHRDIKCDNVLLTSGGICKLADFGASKNVGNAAGASRAANTMIGTPFFMAPEILTGAMGDDSDEEGEQGYGKKADIWSLGITILELMNRGNPPWPEFPNQGAAFMHIASDEGVPVIPEHVQEHPDVVDFINRCCVRDPKKRWSANDLLDHQWLSGTTLEGAAEESACWQMDHPGDAGGGNGSTVFVPVEKE